MTWIHVRGNPAPQGSKRHVGGGRLIESSKRLPAWRIAVQDAALQHLDPIPAGVPVRVEIHFVMPRPKSLPKSRPTPPAVKRIGDLDKLCRAILDGLDGPAYADDSQVTVLVADKRIAEPGEEPGARIHVSPAEAPEPPTPTQCCGHPMNSSDRPQITPANTTPTPKEPHAMPYVDPCATCRIRDHWCCDPWENHFDHEGETE